MKEAKIECLVREYPVHDLGLSMRRGQVEFVDATRAEGSQDLQDAVRIGAVRVRYVERSRMTRKPDLVAPPPNVRLRRRGVLRGGSQPIAPVQPPTPPQPPTAPTVNLEEVRRVAREEAKAGAREGVLEALEALQAQGPGIDQATLEAALRNVLPSVAVPAAASSTASPARKSSGPEEPVFIPQGLVDKDAKADITTTSVEGEAGDLDAAAAALKAAKGTGGRRKKKTSEE